MNLEKLRNEIKSFYIGKFFLLLLSFLYRFAFFIKKSFYSAGIINPKSFKKPIICVGNISTGGTGKTTFVISLSKELAKSDIKTAVTMRGYKSGYAKNDVADSKIVGNFFEDQKMADEQKLISLSLKDLGIPVVASKNRKKAIEYAIDRYNPDVLIMDDGFQNFSIKKDLNIVILNINMLYDKILPVGNLRESYLGLKRANFVILNHCELFDSDYIEKAYSYVKKYVDENKIIKASYVISGFLNNVTGEKISLEYFRRNFKDVALFSGIGDNSQFKKMIEKSGFKVLKVWQFPDHYKYSYEELKSINNLRDGLPLLTTYKDSVKFMSKSKEIFSTDIYSADVDIRLSENSIIDSIKKILK